MLFVLLLSLSVSFGCALEWETQQISPSTIAAWLQDSDQTFIAKQNDSIFILGGHYQSGIMFIQFNTNSDSFIKPANTYGFGEQWAQSSTQIGDELFMLPYNDYNIAKLNLNTLQTEHITAFPGDTW
eukprot:222752_1